MPFNEVLRRKKEKNYLYLKIDRVLFFLNRTFLNLKYHYVCMHENQTLVQILQKWLGNPDIKWNRV